MTTVRRLFGEQGRILRDTSLQVLLLAAVTAPMGPALLSPMLQSMVEPLDASPDTIGLLMTAYFVPAVVLTPVVGVLMDRWGRERPLVAALALFGTAGTVIAFATTFEQVVVLRLVQGVGGAGIIPIIITSVGDLYAGPEEAAAQGFRLSLAGIAQTIAPLVAGGLVVVGWRFPLLLYAIAIPIAGACYLWFDEPSADAASDRAADTGRSHFRNVVEVVLSWRIVAVLVALMVPPFAYFGFLTYVSFLVGGVEGAPRAAGVLVAASSIVYAGTATQAGRVTAFFGRRRGPLVGANGCIAAGLSVIALAPSFAVQLAGTIVFGVGIGVSLALYRSVVTGIGPPSVRGSLVSIAETGNRVGAAIAPLAMGLAIDAMAGTFGFRLAVRWTHVGVGVLGGTLGIACLIVASRGVDEL